MKGGTVWESLPTGCACKNGLLDGEIPGCT